MKTEDVQEVARRVIKPNAVVWVVVGDRTKIEEPLQALGLGPVTYLDADGNRL
jgi:zinc protease